MRFPSHASRGSERNGGRPSWLKRTRKSGDRVPTAMPSERLPRRAIRKDAEKRNQCLPMKDRRSERGLFSAGFKAQGESIRQKDERTERARDENG